MDEQLVPDPRGLERPSEAVDRKVQQILSLSVQRRLEMAKKHKPPSSGVAFMPCSIKNLPADKLIAASRTAHSINPINRPSSIGARIGMDTPEHIALLTTKYWGAGGVHLTVGFTEPISDALATKIIKFMNMWSITANVSFTRSKMGAQVRISRGSGGYWSYLGTDILHIPTNQQTMNLEGFSESTPESEFYRVVCHETGHTLAMPHEHMRQALVEKLDPQKTIAYFMATQGWSEEEVMQQVLTSLDEASLMSTPADQDSIMCYQLPGEITLDGQPIRGGTKIDGSDSTFAATVYPKPSAPVVAPPDGSTASVQLTVNGKIVYSK